MIESSAICTFTTPKTDAICTGTNHASAETPEWILKDAFIALLDNGEKLWEEDEEVGIKEKIENLAHLRRRVEELLHKAKDAGA